MQHISELMSTDVRGYLQAHEDKGMLRFITCGSVDDGKSTLIGRLLFDSKMLFEDQLATLEADSKKIGTTGGDIDYALLLDGLQAEREQGITIDVAYRFFTTDTRKFIVADTPGHEQYTRNMATGASNADLAIILVDARKGVLTQTRRHSYLVSLLGIKHVVVAINKMDLVDYSKARFESIIKEYKDFAKEIGLQGSAFIPMSALKGDNVSSNSDKMYWYDGPNLMEYLETVDVSKNINSQPFSFPVQWVNRPNLDFRGYSGTVSSGVIKPGDEVVILPSGQKSHISRIVTMDGDIQQAVAGKSVTVTLSDDIDVSRGDILASSTQQPEVTDQFSAHIVWMHEEPMLPERSYLLKLANQTVPVTITELKHKVNVNTLEKLAGKTLELNEVGVCNLATDRPITYKSYSDNRELGGFVLIDRTTNNTVAAGMIDFGLRRATNLVWQDSVVEKQSRTTVKHHKPCVLWFTGLSGAGKSTIANQVERKLHEAGHHTYILDGDNIRHGLNKDLGFTDADRVENIRRVAEVARLFADAGLIVLVSFISPFRSERAMARALMDEGEFIEVFVNTSLELCEQRDPKGLYKKARDGKIANFTGIDSVYEPPLEPEINLETQLMDKDSAANSVVTELKKRAII